MVAINQKPLSRFWACFFSFSVFGILWVYKMKKTRKWIPIVVVSVITSIIDRGLLIQEEYWYPTSFESSLIFNIYDFISIVVFVLAIYFMFRWTTEYNLRNFGFKSKKDWKRNKVNDSE